METSSHTLSQTLGSWVGCNPGPSPTAEEGEVPKEQKGSYETDKKHKTGILEGSGAAFSFTSGASTSFLLIGLATDEEYSNDSLHDTY